jgi:uncharacterized protein YegP (UPF0339 family)
MIIRVRKAGTKFVWRMRDGTKQVAASTEGFTSSGACRARVRQLQSALLNPPTPSSRSDGDVVAEGGLQLRFEIVRQAGKWRWRVRANNIVVARSPQQPSHAAATSAANKFRAAAPLTLITGLLPLVFTADKPSRHWGEPVTLTPAVGSKFGAAPGSVWIVGLDPTSQNQVLGATWSDTQIRLTLPETAPFNSLTYALRVRTAGGAEGELPILVDFDLAAFVKKALGEQLANVSSTPSSDRNLDPYAPEFPVVPVAITNLPAGKLTLPTGQVIDVSVAAKWQLEDETGNQLGEEWFRCPDKTLTSGTLSVVPPVAERADQSVSRQIRFNVEATATGYPSPPPLERVVKLRALPVIVPSAVIMFSGPGFTAEKDSDDRPPCILLVLPGREISRPGAVELIETLASTLGLLNQVFGAVPWLPTLPTTSLTLTKVAENLGEVLAHSSPDTNFGAKVNVETYAGQRLLERAKFWQVGLFSFTAQDSISSLCLIGVSGTTAKFFVRRYFQTGDGAFTLTIPDKHIAAFIEDLHFHDVTVDPSEAFHLHEWPDDTFGDQLSSFHMAGFT